MAVDSYLELVRNLAGQIEEASKIGARQDACRSY